MTMTDTEYGQSYLPSTRKDRKAVDDMCTVWTMRKITDSLQTYMKHVDLEGC